MQHKEANRKYTASIHCSLPIHSSYAHPATGFPRWRYPGCKYKHYTHRVPDVVVSPYTFISDIDALGGLGEITNELIAASSCAFICGRLLSPT